MPEYDGELIIHSELDKGDFESDIDRLTRLLEEKKAQIENLKAEYASYMDRTSKTKEQLYIEQEITKTQKEREKLLKDLKIYQGEKQSFEIGKQIKETETYLKRLQTRLDSIKVNPNGVQSVKDLKKEISEATKEAKSLQKQINKAIAKKSIPQTINTDKLSVAMSKLSNATSKFGSVFKGVFGSIMYPINSVISGISTLGKRILRLGSYVLIFNVIRGGFRQFRDDVTAALSTNAVFMNSLNKLKSNLMVAFYPIYQYILPAINTLMSVLIKASSYLANFLSMITGTTIKQSVAGAKAIYDEQQAMKSTGAATDSTTKSIKDQKSAFDKLGKSINGSKKELAAFDKIMVLSQNKEKTPKALTPKNDGFVFTPDVRVDSIYDNMVTIFDKLIKNIDWDKLNNSLENFLGALKPFSETIGNGLSAFYENVIIPFSQWAINNLIPAALDALKGALDFLNPVAQQSGDYLGKLYDTFLKPAAKWTGEAIVNGLKGIGSSLSTIGDWIEKNSWFVEIVASLITGITTALIGYNTVMFITSGALAAAATSAWAFTTALLANPITWIVGLIGLLISALIELGIHWDDVKQSGVNFFNAIKNSIQDIIKWFKWVCDEIGKFFGMLKFLGTGVNFSPQDQFAFSKFKPFTSQIPKRIPGFAQGAVLKGGDPMLAYLNDQPRGQINIETPLNTMIKAFNEALARNNNATGNVVIQADGDVAGIVDMLRFNIKQRDELIGTNYIPDTVF